ncbi:MAG: glycosyltransferase [Candidatus Latescibacterota bacterium]|nr:MAG: glycosyltransferase [Candidatus Latescibacterota bacterium]
MSKLKRICMLSVHGYFDPVPVLGATDTGGQVTYVIELSKALAELGIKVDIYTRRFGGRSEVDAVNDDVRVIRIPCGSDEFIRKEDLFPHLDEFVNNMEAYIRKNELTYDLFHSHYWDAGYSGMNLAERFGLPFIYTAHSLGAWKKEQMGGDPEEMEKLFKFTERIHWENIIFRKATAQTVTTLDGKETYKRLYDFESDDLVIIPPGVDVRRFRPTPTEFSSGIETPESYIFALSRIDSNKGIDYLIKAFALVRKKSNAVLLIGGGSKNPKEHEIDVKNNLLQLVDSLDLRDRVTFTGYVRDEDLDTYYRNARVFVLPSKYEPFGMTVLEAMACNTPVVATGYGGLRHVLTDRRDSLLVDPSNTEELASAIIEVLTDEMLAAKLSEVGLRLIERRFSWQSIARQTVSFYEKYV